MVRTAALTLLLLAGCSVASKDTDQIEADLFEVQTESMVNKADIENLEAKMETRLEALEKAHDSLVGTVNQHAEIINKNARVNNENAAADMTARGACGTERVTLPDGAITVRNRECTEKDLR